MSDVNSTGAAKVCPGCGLPKLFSDFYRDQSKRDGLYSRCKSCHGRSTNAWQSANREKASEIASRYRERNHDTVKARDRTAKNARYKNDPDYAAKRKAHSKSWRAANQERFNRYQAVRRIAKREDLRAYCHEYYEIHSEQIKARVRAYEIANREALRPKDLARVKKRQALKAKATPSWANRAAMKDLYRKAALLSATTGIPHHVDHVVPLQHRLVCGLHVEGNLRIITAAENQTKSNRTWPES